MTSISLSERASGKLKFFISATNESSLAGRTVRMPEMRLLRNVRFMERCSRKEARPHPGPLPLGEGESHATHLSIELSSCCGAVIGELRSGFAQESFDGLEVLEMLGDDIGALDG